MAVRQLLWRYRPQLLQIPQEGQDASIQRCGLMSLAIFPYDRRDDCKDLMPLALGFADWFQVHKPVQSMSTDVFLMDCFAYM